MFSLVPMALVIAKNYQQLIMLLMALFLVLIVELLNTAIEIVIDPIGPEFHELSGRAKDIGSAMALSMLFFVRLGANRYELWLILAFNQGRFESSIQVVYAIVAFDFQRILQ